MDFSESQIYCIFLNVLNYHQFHIFIIAGSSIWIRNTACQSNAKKNYWCSQRPCLSARRDRFASAWQSSGAIRDWIDARAADNAVASIDALLDAPVQPHSLEEVVELALLAARAAPADADVLRARGRSCSPWNDVLP